MLVASQIKAAIAPSYPTFRRIPVHYTCLNPRLLLARAGDGWRRLVLDGTGVAAGSLDRLDNALRLDVVIGNLAEDDVLAVEPGGDDGGDEELGAVAKDGVSAVQC